MARRDDEASVSDGHRVHTPVSHIVCRYAVMPLCRYAVMKGIRLMLMRGLIFESTGLHTGVTSLGQTPDRR